MKIQERGAVTSRAVILVIIYDIRMIMINPGRGRCYQQRGVRAALSGNARPGFTRSLFLG